ncbi:hypothetical protein [Entomospira culicis]|uniref:Uncharacterized protein n=1 Tax=Entomospira culicis TaxID=2719989 RepID=A0A968GG06_9SPIO|nr:hypothetical protein [Entomospira culicis]NIZ19282.1 hypothetical protein [Entomospira culicis]NIZ69813.1 hypothetical protein [Entomospira culicis]WDI36920.1 hypothetical protein PVA46_06250 [Entomospira culicis]WDI38549.1 hypothetical protein PVA47_06260 [Entomospira culicis]
MKKEINYEDNIFFIVAQVEQLTQMLDLSLDGDFLCDKYILDINFFDRTLKKIEGQMMQNSRLIHFPQYLQLIRRARTAMESLLQQIQYSDKNLPIQFRQKLGEEFQELLYNQQTQIQHIINHLHANGNNEKDSDVESIGFEEMSLLIGQDFYEEDQDS